MDIRAGRPGDQRSPRARPLVVAALLISAALLVAVNLGSPPRLLRTAVAAGTYRSPAPGSPLVTPMSSIPTSGPPTTAPPTTAPPTTAPPTTAAPTTVATTPPTTTSPPTTTPAPVRVATSVPSGGISAASAAASSATEAAAGYGCAAALTYLQAHAAPGFTFECPGDALGHQAMTCAFVAGVCPNSRIIAIADPCPAAYMNEAYNSRVAEGLASGPFDPYGYCRS